MPITNLMELVTTLWSGSEQSTLERFTVTLLLIVTAPNLCLMLFVLVMVFVMSRFTLPRRMRLGMNRAKSPETVMTGPLKLDLRTLAVCYSVWVLVTPWLRAAAWECSGGTVYFLRGCIRLGQLLCLVGWACGLGATDVSCVSARLVAVI